MVPLCVIVDVDCEKLGVQSNAPKAILKAKPRVVFINMKSKQVVVWGDIKVDELNVTLMTGKNLPIKSLRFGCNF